MDLKRVVESRAFFVTVVLIGNAIGWAIPGNVVKRIAREDHVLLGRYSRAQMSWLIGAAILSAVAVFIRLGASPAKRRRRLFGVVAFAAGLVPALLIVDIAVRLRTDYPYAPGAFVYRRPANARYEVAYEDLPALARSLPRTPAGYGRVQCVMSYDEEGFRNTSKHERCDVVTLGDSFTEGSRVSDGQPWPARLAELSGLSVCNLGMSGYGPQEYLSALEHYGLPKRPKLVLCMLYEGNDFRSARMTVKSGITLGQIVATSPIIVCLNDFLINTFGPIGSKRDVEGLDDLSWLPISIPDGPGAKYYTFAAKQLTDLYAGREMLELEGSWYVTSEILKKMRSLCEKAGATFVVVYAPSKAHVVVPLAADRLNGEKVRRYLLFKKETLELPRGEEFIASLLAYLPNQESVIREWCEERSIPFFSLTESLSGEVARGRQVYYTFDQHWSPDGHASAAQAVYAFVQADPSLTVMAAYMRSHAAAD